MATRNDQEIDNLVVLARYHHQPQADRVQDPVQQVELHTHQIPLLSWYLCPLTQSRNLFVLSLPKVEDPDVSDGNKNGAAEEGDAVEESEGVVHGEEPHWAGVQPRPGTREAFLSWVEQITSLTTGFKGF